MIESYFYRKIYQINDVQTWVGTIISSFEVIA